MSHEKILLTIILIVSSYTTYTMDFSQNTQQLANYSQESQNIQPPLNNKIFLETIRYYPLTNFISFLDLSRNF